MTSLNQQLKLLTRWANKSKRCSDCDISKLCEYKVTHRLKSFNNQPIEAILIGEAPGMTEYLMKEPFVPCAPGGDELEAILEETFHKHKLSYLLTNAILCTPFESEQRAKVRPPTKEELRYCTDHLGTLLEIIKPSIIVALGKSAEYSLKQLHIEDVVAVAHPSYILSAKQRRDYLFAKAVLDINEAICPS